MSFKKPCNLNTSANALKDRKRITDKDFPILSFSTADCQVTFRKWINLLNENAASKKWSNAEIIEFMDAHCHRDIRLIFRHYRKHHTFNLKEFTEWFCSMFAINYSLPSTFMKLVAEDMPDENWQSFCHKWHRIGIKVDRENGPSTLLQIAQGFFIDSIHNRTLQRKLREQLPVKMVVELVHMAQNLAKQESIPLHVLDRAVIRDPQPFKVPSNQKERSSRKRVRTKGRKHRYFQKKKSQSDKQDRHSGCFHDKKNPKSLARTRNYGPAKQKKSNKTGRNRFNRSL